MRALGLVALVLLVGCREAPSSQSSPSVEVSRVVGRLHTLEIRPPQGAQTFSFTPGLTARLSGARGPDGRLHLTVGLRPQGCPKGQFQLMTQTSGVETGTCLELPETHSTRTFPTTTRPLPMNQWIPLFAVEPFVPAASGGEHLTESDPEQWEVVSVYFSAEDDPEALGHGLPDASTALDIWRDTGCPF